ncbi:MAG: 30S ribosomal protein S20 [Elusimicrobia bacterium]|nr:30S ribosomal protein S20 [Elusimicrobiota bacterium]
MTKLKMGRHTSAIKESRKNIARHRTNSQIKNQIKQLIKDVSAAIAKKDSAAAKSTMLKAFTALDKAAKKNILSKNNASRKKSRMALKVKTLVLPA